MSTTWKTWAEGRPEKPFLGTVFRDGVRTRKITEYKGPEFVKLAIRDGITHWAPAPELPVKSQAQLDEEVFWPIWNNASTTGEGIHRILANERAAILAEWERQERHLRAYDDSFDAWLRIRCGDKK